jgi:hypothetical protein
MLAKATGISLRSGKRILEAYGRIAYLSPQTAARLHRWLEAAEITKDPVFRGLHLARVAEVHSTPHLSAACSQFSSKSKL